MEVFIRWHAHERCQYSSILGVTVSESRIFLHFCNWAYSHSFSSRYWVPPTPYWPVLSGQWWPLWFLSINWGRPMACKYLTPWHSEGRHTFQWCQWWYLSVSMQSIQNLGLALISMVAGTILDTRGYLILEVFFCTCVCSELFCLSVLLLGLSHNSFSVLVALMAVVSLYFVDYLRGKRGTLHHALIFLPYFV